VKRVLASAFALALALAVVACGTATQSEDDQPKQLLTAAQVMNQFRQAPGQPKLRATAEPDVAWEQLGLGLNVPARLLERYGVFSIYVVEPSRPEAVRSLLTNKETRKALKRSAAGIYWEYDTASRSYVAYKRYGSNVVLAWWNEKRAPGTDARWTRLDALMSGLETG